MIKQDLDLLAKYPFNQPLKILVTGASGLIGQALCQFLRFSGHDVWQLTRTISKSKSALSWNSVIKKVKHADFEGFDAVVHLAGENIGRGRWTKARQARFVSSRVEVTQRLVDFLSGLKNPPKTFMSASAVGFYGDRGSQWLTEEDGAENKMFFLANLCRDWEQAVDTFTHQNVRVIKARFGIVFSDRGGVLQQMILPFKCGLGGVIGKGTQYLSWIALEDLIGALYHILMTPTLSGVVNCVSPNPVQQRFFAQILAKRLHRWCVFSVPASFVKLCFGQKGKELLLASTRVRPKHLLETGYSFHYPTLEKALEHLI